MEFSEALTLLFCVSARLKPYNKTLIQHNKKDYIIMKKTYITPSVEVIKVDVANMMATSMPIVDGTVDTNNVADQLSREMNRSIEMLNQVWQ